ncbi:MAG: alpha/beta hydrolase [Puia sp.]|nr:alpha/beta hydrolase [Puia sp.]
MVKAITYLVENKGDLLFTSLYPAPDKETVILLHGGPGFPDGLVTVAALLSGFHQVISFEQRGTARSPCRSNDYSMEAYVSDIEAIVSYYQIGRFHLFGHSWGGLYAQIYADRHPERLLSLFLCCPGSGTGMVWRQTEKEVLRFNRLQCTSLEWIKMGLNDLMGIFGSDAAYKRLFRQVMSNYNKGFPTKVDTYLGSDHIKATPINKTRRQILRYPSLKRVCHPGFPITIVYGDHDIYGKSREEVINRYPTANIQTLEHCGHFPWIHHPAKFREVMNGHFRNFLIRDCGLS